MSVNSEVRGEPCKGMADSGGFWRGGGRQRGGGAVGGGGLTLSGGLDQDGLGCSNGGMWN